MIKLTDLELCKKIAEIEGFPLCDEWDCCANGVLTGTGKGDLEHYNPLTNKTLLFDLMVKHKVTINYYIRSVTTDDHHTSFEFASEAEIPRAILECIIESNR